MDYGDPNGPNIAGAGNYAQMLQQSLTNLGRQQQRQQPRPATPATPSTPAGNVFSSPFLGGGTGDGQTNYMRLLASLFGR